MTASYDGRPEQLWPSRVERVAAGYLIDNRWWVCETGQQWDAWPWPEAEDPSFDDQAYMREHLAGRGAATASEKIRDLIGDPR